MNKILIINGPNLNLIGEREQSQYGSKDYKYLEKFAKKSIELNLILEMKQSNLEGEIVENIQSARKKFDGIIINAGGYSHTSVSIRDALDIFKGKKIELHISNIYKRGISSQISNKRSSNRNYLWIRYKWIYFGHKFYAWDVKWK